MCNRYESPTVRETQVQWSISNAADWPGGGVYPRALGYFIRAGQSAPEGVVGRWGLIPPFATTANIPYSTNNARSEEVAQKPSYRDAWRRGQRCIIPANSFDEPCWETGKNVWWRFNRADGLAWGLAGLWHTWVDKRTGEVIDSYTMLTVNADEHPIMGRMHKPYPKLPPNQQDKRSVIAIAEADVERWLYEHPKGVADLLNPPPVASIAGHALG